MNAPAHDPQVAAADPKVSAFVSANAGSGKTSTLVNRVARLLLRGAPPETILCVTYTKAAAAEMQRRLFLQLGGWSTKDNDALRADLAQLERRPAESYDDEALSVARTLFAKALETPGGLKIQTIHAFCEKLLRRFPLEAGVAPGFTVLEDADAREVSARAREALARAVLADPDGALGQAYAHFAVELDHAAFEAMFVSFEAQRRAIQAYADACAAQGLDVSEDVWTVCGFDEPVDPDDLEADAVAGTDWQGWARAAQALYATGSTQDAKLAAKLAALAECAGSPGGFEACWAAFATAAGEPLQKLGTTKLDPAIIEWLRDEQSRLHDTLKQARAARCAMASIRALALARAHAALYLLEKHIRGALDFSDLIELTLELLTKRSDAAWVLYKLDGGIDHVLVDEAQDTAPEQWAIFRALTEDFFAGAGARAGLERTVFAVGDEKQSIYSFQGAAPEQFRDENNFYNARAEAAERAFTGVALTDSWRSTPQVLGFVDAVFADPETREAVPPSIGDEAVRHLARRGDPGAVDLWPLFKDEPREEAEAWDAPLDTSAPDSARKRLARQIADYAADLIHTRRGVFTRDGVRPATAGDVLILVRRRDALFEEIIRALKKAGVPVAGADRLRLSDHVVFQDLLGLIRFALFPDDDLTLAALLRSPFCDVDEQGLYDLAQPRAGVSLWDALRGRGGERPAWTDALALLGWAKDNVGRAPFDFLARVLQRTDGDGLAMRRRILTRLGPEAEDALDEMLAQALAAERRGVRDLERFAAAMTEAEVEVKRELEGAGEQARVMTVHGAKGLEAPIVILPDTTGRPPPARSGLMKTPEGGFLWAGRKAEDGEALGAARRAIEAKGAAESLRLLYVALTRARDRLVVCGRISARDKGAPEGGWYDRVERAFARPEIAAHTRPLNEHGQELLRYGADFQAAAFAASAGGGQGGAPSWSGRPAPPEPMAAAYASPSDMTDLARDISPSPFARAGGMGRFRRGNLIHRLLQLLPDLQPEDRAAAAARLLGKERDLSAEQMQEMAQAALAVLSDPQFAEVFGPGSRAEAAIAGEAPGLPEGLGISGRVDRMVITQDRVLVADFKTNRPAPARVEDADPAYLTQMAIYAAVLRAIFPGRRVEAALIWTDGPRLMPVPEAVMAERLSALSVAVD